MQVKRVNQHQARVSAELEEMETRHIQIGFMLHNKELMLGEHTILPQAAEEAVFTTQVRVVQVDMAEEEETLDILLPQLLALPTQVLLAAVGKVGQALQAMGIVARAVLA